MEKSYFEKLNRDRVETRCLVGEFLAQLTCAETNEWSEFVRDTDEYMEYQMACAATDRVVRQGSAESLEYAVRRELAAKHTLYTIAKSWYEGLRKRREEAPE